MSGFLGTFNELSGQVIGVAVPARTSGQYYNFHLVRFIIGHPGSLRLAYSGKKRCPGCHADSLYKFSSVHFAGLSIQILFVQPF